MVLASGLAGCGETRLPSGPSPDQPGFSNRFPRQVRSDTDRESSWRALCPTPHGDPCLAPAWRSSTARRPVYRRPPTRRGEFRLTGTFDETTHFRATKDGHVAETRPFPERCAACKPNWWIRFNLETVAPKSTSRASTSSPSSPIPPAPTFQTRRAREPTELHHADGGLGRGPSRFDVRVSSPTILPSFNSFTIGVAGDYMGSRSATQGTPAPALWNRSHHRYVTLDGAVTAFLTDASTIAAPLNGAVYVCELAGVFDFPYNCGGPGESRAGGVTHKTTN